MKFTFRRRFEVTESIHTAKFRCPNIMRLVPSCFLCNQGMFFLQGGSKQGPSLKEQFM